MLFETVVIAYKISISIKHYFQWSHVGVDVLYFMLPVTGVSVYMIPKCLEMHMFVHVCAINCHKLKTVCKKKQEQGDQRSHLLEDAMNTAQHSTPWGEPCPIVNQSVSPDASGVFSAMFPQMDLIQFARLPL